MFLALAVIAPPPSVLLRAGVGFHDLSQGLRGGNIRRSCSRLRSQRGQHSRAPGVQISVEGWKKGNFGNRGIEVGSSPCGAWLSVITSEGNFE